MTTSPPPIPKEKIAGVRAKPESSPLDDKVRVKRPAMFTRPSNDYITNLMRTNNGNLTTESLPNTPPVLSRQISQMSIQQPERRPMTSSNPPKNKWRILGACLWSFVGGFSDAAPGALLPTIENHYGVSYSIVSLIWMSNAVGFILVAVFSNKIQPWLGREKSLPLGCMCSVIMYALVASGGPFPLIVTGFFFGGIGLAIVLAQVNIFLTKLEKNSKYLSFFHGSYGLGATVSPFVATTMIEHDVKWNYTYIIMLALMLMNLVNLYFAYKGSDDDLSEWEHDEETEKLLKAGSRGVDSGIQTPAEREDGVGLQDLGTHLTAAFDPDTAKKTTSDSEAMKMALKNRLTWNISMFVFLYQGCEVSLGGWIVSYLVDYRHTTTSYGYVSSGFWGGLTIGRLALTRPLHKYVGARRSINLLVTITMAMVVLTWVVPNDILSSVFVSIAGVLIGPIYPLMIANVSQMLPRKIQMIGLTIMTAFGSSGGAVLPFLVGLIAQSSGTYVVLPICIASYVVMISLWLMLPNIEWSGETPKTFGQKVRYVFW